MLEAEEESSDFKKCKHVQDVGLVKILLIVLSVALFVGDIGSDWYQTLSYLHTSHGHTRNSLDNTIEELFSQEELNKTHTFYKLFCGRVSENYNNKELFFINSYLYLYQYRYRLEYLI